MLIPIDIFLCNISRNILCNRDITKSVMLFCFLGGVCINGSSAIEEVPRRNVAYGCITCLVINGFMCTNYQLSLRVNQQQAIITYVLRIQ